MNTDTPNGIGLAEAASRIEALSEPDNTEPSTIETADENAETEPVEGTAADTSEEETPPEDDEEPSEEEDDSSDEEGADEEEATTDDDDTADDEKLLERPFTVKIGGKEETVTLKEALAGYQRQADYTRSKMTLADERRSFEGDRQAIQTERAQYAQLLPLLIQQIEAGMEVEPDWADLLANDPNEYLRQEVAWREKSARHGAAQQERQRLEQIAQQQQQAAIAEALNTSSRELAKAMPAWQDANRWNADRDKLMAYGQKLGFAEEELKHTYDHRAVLALYKAMRYDELMAKKPQPSAPNGPKSVSPGSPNSAKTRTVSNVSRAKQRLGKSGSIRDAASLFEQLDP
jgi:hypothetical protein